MEFPNQLFCKECLGIRGINQCTGVFAAMCPNAITNLWLFLKYITFDLDKITSGDDGLKLFAEVALECTERLPSIKYLQIINIKYLNSE